MTSVARAGKTATRNFLAETAVQRKTFPLTEKKKEREGEREGEEGGDGEGDGERKGEEEGR